MKKFASYVRSQLLFYKQNFWVSFLQGESFALWGLLVVLLNFIMLHGQGFGSDLAYWRNWIHDLEQGVGNFRGDYPPVYVLWLQVVSWFYHATQLSLDLEYELKQFCLLPVILAHVSLAHFVWLRLRNRSWHPSLKLVAMLLVVANPIFYLDGPVWGQVDALPVTICIWALWYAAKPKTFSVGIGLFMLGLLTKFQMIMFLPVFGALALRYRKIMWKGLLSAGVVFFLVFLPFILSGSFTKEISQAYMNTLGQYPYASMNAGNLWLVAAGNMTPQDNPLFSWGPSFLTPSIVGKVLFVIISAVIMAVTFFKRLSMGRIMMLSTLSAFAFFMVLPCMHERYVFSAAAVCIAGIACQKKPSVGLAIGISAVTFMNISMLMSTRGSALWFWISMGAILCFAAFIFQTISPSKFENLCNKVKRIPMPGIVPYVVLLCIYVFDMISTFNTLAETAYKLKDGESFVYDLPLVSQRQGYGSTHIGKSVDGNPLTLDGNIYVAGIGVHAPSQHVYELPENATRFTAFCGVDDESGNGSLECIVKLDNRELWRSGRLEGRSRALVDVDIRGGRRLYLITDELGSKNFDHVDWVNPVVYTE